MYLLISLFQKLFATNFFTSLDHFTGKTFDVVLVCWNQNLVKFENIVNSFRRFYQIEIKFLFFNK